MPILVIEKSIEINAAPADVFAALTDPEQITAYYPLDAVHVERKAGGSFILEGNFAGRPFKDYGTIEVFDAPREFRYCYWSDNHGTERAPENHMTIQYLLEEAGGRTRLRLCHRNLLTNERHSMMSGVWDHLLALLKSYAEERMNGRGGRPVETGA
jgi:uncharacterized protein YndB with AHSA1/START domain